MKKYRFPKITLCGIIGHRVVKDKVINHLGLKPKDNYQSCEAHCKRCNVKMFGTTAYSKLEPKVWAYIELK